ncbi:phasin family protein [Bradyrhizobium sp. 40]|uniref:phasin family protein n=1 Tax=Bradyrhizobium sp. 40 TaxID=2782674 RepID=UPI001FFEEFED|nr:phasin family protein [Bradyrhizobium sp. 40]
MNENVNGAKPKFVLSFQELLRGFAAPTKKNIASMKAISEEISDVLREACSMNARGAVDYGAKVIEISKDNTSATWSFSRLVETRPLLDIVRLSTARSSEAFEVVSAQNRELWELAQKVAIETTEPSKPASTGYCTRPPEPRLPAARAHRLEGVSARTDARSS